MNRSKRRSPQERRWLRLLSTLNEFQARLFAADKALDQGRGGISRMSELTGMSRTTLTRAVAELTRGGKLEPGAEGRIRAGGAEKSGRRGPATARGTHPDGGRNHGGRSDERPAVDQPIDGSAGGGTDPAGTSGERQDGSANLGRDGVLAAVEP